MRLNLALGRRIFTVITSQVLLGFDQFLIKKKHESSHDKEKRGFLSGVLNVSHLCNSHSVKTCQNSNY